MGSANGFTGQIQIGGTTLLTRSGASSETAFAGRAAFGLYSGGQQWDAESWGGALPFQTAVGTASEDPAQALTVNFLGDLAAAGSDSVVLRNFTVIRYPAQVNP
jgi:hypothetical protein